MLKIEAAYLYHFFQYVTFPPYATPQQKKQATICVHGRDPLLPYLQYVSMRQTSLELHARKLEGHNLEGCDLLYIGPNAHAEEQAAILTHTRGKPIVTVGMEGFLNVGGMIELHHQQDRIAMYVHKSRMDEAGLQMSSRLLVLAMKVHK